MTAGHGYVKISFRKNQISPLSAGAVDPVGKVFIPEFSLQTKIPLYRCLPVPRRNRRGLLFFSQVRADLLASLLSALRDPVTVNGVGSPLRNKRLSAVFAEFVAFSLCQELEHFIAEQIVHRVKDRVLHDPFVLFVPLSKLNRELGTPVFAEAGILLFKLVIPIQRSSTVAAVLFIDRLQRFPPVSVRLKSKQRINMFIMLDFVVSDTPSLTSAAAIFSNALSSGVTPVMTRGIDLSIQQELNIAQQE